MTIDTADAALTCLRDELAPRRRRLLTIAALALVGLLVVGLLLRRFVMHDPWGEALAQTPLSSAGFIGFALVYVLVMGPTSVTKSVAAFRPVRITRIRTASLDVAFDGDTANIPVELPRGRSHLSPGDTVWVPDPFCYYDRQPVVTTRPDARGRHVLWPIATTSHRGQGEN